MGKNLSSRQRLQQMLAMALGRNQMSPIFPLPDNLELGSRMKPPSPSTRTLADKWLDQVGSLEEVIPTKVRDHATLRFGQIRFERVFDDGEIQGTCLYRGELFQVFAHCGGDLPPAGCSCEASLGEFPCPHVDAFVQHLLHDLEKTDSPLRKRINTSRFNAGKPDRRQYKPDLDARNLSKLESLLSSLPRPSKIAPEDLPTMVVAAAERVVWNFFVGGERLHLSPSVQQQKKRGDGFTKGKKISLDRLRSETNLTLTPADSEIISSIEFKQQDRYGQRSCWMLSPLASLATLIGQGNVLLSDQPCQVRRRAYDLALDCQDGKWEFLLVNESGQPCVGTTISMEGHIATLDTSAATIWYSPLPPGIFELIQSLLRLPAIRHENLQSLCDQSKRLQQVYAVRLPEQIAGPIVSRGSLPAIVLRSHSDGALDYGFRVRDAGGGIHKPGAQPSITADIVDGRPIQYRRNLANEMEQAIALAADLGISRPDDDGWNGSIRDFRAGLMFIEALQSQHDNIEVLWDKTSEKPIKVLGNLTSKNVRVDITSKRNWFGISGQCDFGNSTLPLNELLHSLSSAGQAAVHGDYIRIADGQWARISENLRKRLARLSDATSIDRKTITLDATAAPVIRDLIDGDIEVKATKNWHQCLARLDRAEKLDPTVPAGLKAELRDYQVDGYKWLRRLAEWGVGGVLADDMGLGKTLQTLAVLLDRVQEGPALVIAPTSVGFNWVREANRFAPDLNVQLYRETDRAEFLNSVGPGDLVICSYGLALRDEAAMAKVEWGTVVMDEAQAVKNSRSKTSQAIGGLNAKWTVALTGTPVENHLGELWSLFHRVSPGVFGGWEQFRKRYALPIEKHADNDARLSLAARLKPFVLRRTKSEVLKDLPPRTETNLYVDLSPEERDQYDRIRASAIGEVDQIAGLGNIQDQRFKLLALLTRLRQFACHPGIVNKQWTGSSAKLDHLCQTMTDLKEESHRALVFSQFTEHLSLIRQAFDAREITYEYLDGSTPAAARQTRVDDFQNGNADAFLISLKAGGTGLNLTAADYVIHMDPWWNPAVEDQATDRAHRIGQDKPVMVYRIISRGTIEEEILSLHDTKRDLVAGVLEGTTAAASLTTSDLLAMIRGQ